MSKKHETDIIICLDYYTNLNHEIINFVSWRTCVALIEQIPGFYEDLLL